MYSLQQTRKEKLLPKKLVAKLDGYAAKDGGDGESQDSDWAAYMRRYAKTTLFYGVIMLGLVIIGIHFLIAGYCIVAGSVFQALGNALPSLITSLMRQLVVLLPAAWLLAQTGDVNMVWWAFPIAEVMSATMTTLFFVREYRAKIKPLPEE